MQLSWWNWAIMLRWLLLGGMGRRLPYLTGANRTHAAQAWSSTCASHAQTGCDACCMAQMWRPPCPHTPCPRPLCTHPLAHSFTNAPPPLFCTPVLQEVRTYEELRRVLMRTPGGSRHAANLQGIWGCYQDARRNTEAMAFRGHRLLDQVGTWGREEGPREG